MTKLEEGFEKISRKMILHLENRGYSIGSFKEMPQFAEEAFYEDDNQHQYTYIFEGKSRKIYLDESTPDSKCRSHLTFEEIRGLNVREIIKKLLDKNESKRNE